MSIGIFANVSFGGTHRLGNRCPAMGQAAPISTEKLVAIIEDEALVRDIVAFELEDCGFRVVEFPTADAALPFLKDHGDELAALVTDVQMPGELNGLQLVGIVSKLWPKLGFLITSGGPLVNPSTLPPQVRFLAKPWWPSDMAAQVREIARMRVA